MMLYLRFNKLFINLFYFIIIKKRQFGLRKGASCCSSVTVLKEIIHSYICKPSIVHYCMVDLSKALERVDAQLIVSKLKNSSVPPLICNLVNFIFHVHMSMLDSMNLNLDLRCIFVRP